VRAFLVAASLAFYAWWDWRYLALIVFSILFNFSLGTRLQRRAGELGASAGRLLALGIGVNLGLLAYFKYRNFLVDTVSTAVGAEWAMAPLVLPLAISFYTFEQITYLVDAYRGDTGEYDFLSYALFNTLYKYTALDDCTRFRVLRLCQRLYHGASLAFLHELRHAFPFPIRRLQCDKGLEFPLEFALALEAAGIRHRYIRPRRPQQNGKVERSHRVRPPPPAALRLTREPDCNSIRAVSLRVPSPRCRTRGGGAGRR
jgi:transposase InsO family protein